MSFSLEVVLLQDALRDVSDYVFGGGHSGLRWTFFVMLVSLTASAYFLFPALRTYPRDVATAGASQSRAARS